MSSPERDNKSIAFKHAQLQTGFAIVEVCNANTPISAHGEHLLCSTPAVKSICKAPHVFHCFVASSERHTLYCNAALVFRTGDRQIFDSAMYRAREVCQRILRVAVGFLERKVDVRGKCASFAFVFAAT